MRCLELLALFFLFFSALLFGYQEDVSSDPSRFEVWSYIQEQAELVHLDPYFVYAIAMAESSLNPEADSGRARGIMQLTKPAWEAVTSLPYSFAWDWRLNVRMGIKYLVICREFLMENQAYSEPRLAACYRYGMHTVRIHGFDVFYLPRPKNDIYRNLLYGGDVPSPPDISVRGEAITPEQNSSSLGVSML